MKQATVFMCIILCFHICSIAGELPDTSFDAVSNYYDRVVAKLVSPQSPCAAAFSVPINRQMIEMEEQSPRLSPIINVQAPLHLIVERDSGVVRQAWNHALDRALAKSLAGPSAPKLQITEVLSMAMTYIKLVGTRIPSNCVLKEISFDRNYPHCWEVRWEPEYGGFTYDDFDSTLVQSIGVVFYEDYGFAGYGCDLNLPPPKNVLVKLSRAEGVLKAEKAAMILMKSPVFLTRRSEGFVVSGVLNAELKISAPNWLLDPSRAVWHRDAAPAETRLCWRIKLETRDASKRQDALLPVRPVVVIYVDAATGEVVGAGFT